MILVSVVGVSSIATGCATIFEGTTSTVTVEADVDGATILADGVAVGVTQRNVPVRVQISKTTRTLAIEHNGVVSSPQPVRLQLSVGWLIVDILLGLVPIVVDAVTGAWLLPVDSDFVFRVDAGGRW